MNDGQYYTLPCDGCFALYLVNRDALKGSSWKKRRFNKAILLTCKEIRTEAQPILYSTNEFEMSLFEAPHHAIKDDMGGGVRLGRISKLALIVTVPQWYTQFDEDYLEHLFMQMTKLQRVRVAIRYHLPYLDAARRPIKVLVRTMCLTLPEDVALEFLDREEMLQRGYTEHHLVNSDDLREVFDKTKASLKHTLG